ncbi:MAG: DUF1573 domain-containing protein [Bacteroidota bacterium]|jgi:hypothetical protein
MQKLPITAILLLLLAGALPAQHLRVDALEKEFGEMRPLDQRTLTFVLTNIATDTIFLGKPKPSCGCTATVLDKSVLSPGDSTQLSVQFHAAPGMNGTVNKSVTLNGRVGGMDVRLAVVRVRAEIVADVRFEPGILRFSAFIGDTVKLEAILHSNTNKPVKIENISAAITAYVDTTEGNKYRIEQVESRPFTAFTLTPETGLLEAGDSTRLTMILYPQEKGQINGSIRIPLSDTELRIPVVGVVLRQRE